jgi:crossover junction endodeoxyribonuclease RuvC
MTRFIGLDPASTTGFVALDEHGNVLEARSIRGEGKTVKGGITTEQLVSLENQVYRLLQPGDEIAIEGPPFATQRAFTAGMLHGGIRSMIERKKLAFNVIAPGTVKKYVGVTGWVGEKGSKRQLKDKEKKDAMKAAVWEHFGWTHKSHDVVDAYVIARIALNVYRYRELMVPLDVQDYQEQVVRDILGEGAAK